MTSTNELGLSTERVRGPAEIDLQDLHCSTICEDILWKPVSCQNCETHFCSKCITKWLERNPNRCPLRCDSFIQRPCSKFIARQLAKLQIVCINQPNGCGEIIPYEALEKHETTCHYQRVKCSACQTEVLQKDLNEHQSRCPALVAKCDDCNMVYKRAEALTQHSDLICLRKQLRDLRQESNHQLQQLKEQLRETQNNQLAALVSRGFIVDDVNVRTTVKRSVLEWTDEMGKLHNNRIVLEPNSRATLSDQLICSQCHNVFWKPVCCKTCGWVTCAICRPSNSFFGTFFSLFTTERSQAQIDKPCKKFIEGTVPRNIIEDLDRLRVRCAFASNGCPVVSPYYELEGHERQCQFENVPCQVCQLLTSRRPPVVEHTLRVCFEEMLRKNPAPIQKQLMALIETNEKVEEDNRRLQSRVDELQKQFNTLDSTCVKKPNSTGKKFDLTSLIDSFGSLDRI